MISELHVLPTDRWDWPPDTGVGVDTIALVGPTTEAMLNELRIQRLDRDISRETGELVDRRTSSSEQFAIGLGSAWVKGKRNATSTTARIELSVPKMLYGHNRDPVGTSHVADAVEVALDLLRERLPDIPRPEHLRIVRLDVARDFQNVASPSATMSALSRREVPHAKHNRHYLRRDGTMQGFTRGSTSQYLVRAYDKGYELSDSAGSTSDGDLKTFLRAWAAVSDQQLRYELQLRPPALKQLGLITMADCTPERLDQVARAYYTRVGWTEPYGGDRVREQVAELSVELTPAVLRNVLIYMQARHLGIEVPLSRHTLEAVRPIVRRYRLLDVDDGSPRRRLDFDSGLETREL